MIGIIGYGYVGKAVRYGFKNSKVIISDPKYNEITTEQLCQLNPKVIFVCVPTPTDDTEYSLLKEILLKIKTTSYKGLVVVKSTILPHHIENFDILYNPEFLSRKTYKKDFVNPPFVVIGGNSKDSKKLVKFYKKNSSVKTKKYFLTDIRTASLVKYTLNCFYGLKITYMNMIYDVCKEIDVDYFSLINIIKHNSWIGSHHFQVPGPDGQRGFGGTCLPKDTEAFTKEYDNELLKVVLKLNESYRQKEK